MKHLYALAWCSLCISFTGIEAQDLTTLQQSYDKAVAEKATAPYQAAVAELNAKYSAALDRLTAAATQAGNLDEAIALRDEKKLLLPDGTLPEDSENTPASLKSARATYRQQVIVLKAARDAATQPLTDHFRSLLQNLLTQTTQAGKLDEALLIREKIATLSAPTPDKMPSVVMPGTPATPPTRSTASSKLITAKSTGKTDPAAAQQVIAWALANGSTVTTSLGVVGQGEKLTTAPQGKFSVTEIYMKSYGDDFPWPALAGLGQLQKFLPSQIEPLTAEQTRHFHNLGSLRFLKMIATTEDGLQAMPVLPNLIELELSYETFDPLPNLHLLQERTASAQILTPFRLPSGEVADVLFSRLSGWPNFRRLQGGTWITPARAVSLATYPKFTELGLMTSAKVDPECLPIMKNLVSVGFNGPQPPAVMNDLRSLPNLQRITLDLEGVAISDLPDFAQCKAVTEIGLDNVPSPAAEVVSKCIGIAGIKIFKLGRAQIEPITINLLLGFKNLEVVSLNGSRFGPEAFTALQQLKALKSLKEVNLKNSGITDADFKALQKALPKCKFIK